MLRIYTAHVHQVLTSPEASGLYEPLQGAIELEHATIPVYLTALLSIKEGALPGVQDALASIVREEMLHMTIVCNVLNAIGGAPRLDSGRFVPRYPGPLPMNINTSLQVHLGSLSLDRIENEFMAIETPENPPVSPFSFDAQTSDFATVGQFYAAVMRRITEFGERIFTGDRGVKSSTRRCFHRTSCFVSPASPRLFGP
jgi:hypothetical protein